MTAPLAQLAELFPTFHQSILQAEFSRANGNLEDAVNALLAKEATSTADSSRQHRLQSQRGRRPNAKGAGWHAVSLNHQQAAGQNPQYVATAGQNEAPDASHGNFPTLQPSATENPAKAKPQGSYRSWGASPGSSAAASPSWSTPPGRRSPVPGQEAIAASAFAADLGQRLSLEAQRPAYALVVGNDKEANDGHAMKDAKQRQSVNKTSAQGLQSQPHTLHNEKLAELHREDKDAVLASLCQHFPCADFDIVQEALLAANGNEAVAQLLLSGIMTPEPSPRCSPQQRRPHPAAGHSGGLHSSDLPKDGDILRAEQILSCQPGIFPASKRSSLNNERPTSLVKKSNATRRAESGAKDRTSATDSSEDDSRVLQPLQAADKEGELNTYKKHRAHALQLDRRRFSRLKAAAADYAAGDHFAAKLAVQEAKLIKAEAAAAHAEAAKQIELENNRGKDLWELDLHGLHLAEANQALDRRAFSYSRRHALKKVQAFRGNLENCCRLSTLEAQQLGYSNRRRLRVIVGRGSHSSGGEAILQRSTQNHLLARHYRFEQRGAILMVQLKHRTAL